MLDFIFVFAYGLMLVTIMGAMLVDIVVHQFQEAILQRRMTLYLNRFRKITLK